MYTQRERWGTKMIKMGEEQRKGREEIGTRENDNNNDQKILIKLGKRWKEK